MCIIIYIYIYYIYIYDLYYIYIYFQVCVSDSFVQLEFHLVEGEHGKYLGTIPLFFVTILGRLSDLQLGDQKVTLNHLARMIHILPPVSGSQITILLLGQDWSYPSAKAPLLLADRRRAPNKATHTDTSISCLFAPRCHNFHSQ